MSAQEDQDNLQTLLCKLCKKPLSEQNQYSLHVKFDNDDSDNKQLVHTCSITDNVDKADFKCSLCDKQFASICTLHDHISRCFRSGSYIFFHRKRTAYPLSKFCSLYENRGKVRDGSRVNCDKSSLDKSEDIPDDTFCDGLEIFLQDTEEEGRWKESKTKFCDIGTDTPNLNIVKDKRFGSKSKKKSNKTKTVCWDSNQGKERARQREHVKETNDILTGAETSTADINTIPSIGGERRLSRQATKRNHSKVQGKESRKDVVNGTAAKHKKLDSEHNQGPNKELVKKRGRPKKVEVTHSEKVVRKRGRPIKIELQTESEPGKTTSKTVIDDVAVGNDNKHETAQADLTEQGSISLEAALGIKEENQLADNENEDLNKIYFLNDATDDFETDKEGGSINNNLHENSKLKSLLRKTGNGMITQASIAKTNTKSNDVKKKQQVSCGVCGVLLCAYKMRKHMVSHSDERPFACDLCPKTYKYQLHLTTHRKTHDSVLPLYCEVCGQGFVDASRLKRHSILHTDERPFSCTECGAGFVTRYKLDRHMTKHTGQKMMQCDLCGMRFATKDGLKSHVSLIHQGERRFQCAECDQRFFTNYQLKCHTMKHSGLRPFKCSLCVSGFIERKELRRHMKKLHNTNMDGESLGQDVKNKSSLDTGKKLAGAKKNNKSSSLQVESVSQATPAVTSSDAPPASVSRTLPVFVATLNQSDNCDNLQGTSRSASEQLQPCNQSFSVTVMGQEWGKNQGCQSNCESDSVKYEICQQTNIKDITYENQSGEPRQYVDIQSRDSRKYDDNQSGDSRQYDENQSGNCRQYDDNQSGGSRQYEVGGEQRDDIYFSSDGERLYIPLFVKDQVEEQQREAGLHSQEHFTLL